MKDYSFQEHSHSFSAWAAARAASCKRTRFRVEIGRKLLEEAGFTSKITCLSDITQWHKIDVDHEAWRSDIVARSSGFGLDMTHGVAAKLINVYAKARFAIGGSVPTEAAGYMHPPIDRLLLSDLSLHNVGSRNGTGNIWGKMARKGWSNFTSDDYQSVIDNVREVTFPDGMWRIESFWRGYK